jgi:hypothetical protein
VHPHTVYEGEAVKNMSAQSQRQSKKREGRSDTSSPEKKLPRGLDRGVDTWPPNSPPPPSFLSSSSFPTSSAAMPAQILSIIYVVELLMHSSAKMIDTTRAQFPPIVVSRQSLVCTQLKV